MNGILDYLEILSILNTLNPISVFVRLILAMFVGAIIGTDRSRRGSPAGLKTHSLVCVGSSLVMLIGEFCVIKYGAGDVTRMSAQVISGIGFLGAGTIMVTGKNQVKGLTSAAGIWFCACVGLALGSGFYIAAFMSVAIVIFVLKILSKMRIDSHDRNVFDIYLELDETFNLAKLFKIIKHYNCEIISIDSNTYQMFDSESSRYIVISMKIIKETLDEMVEVIAHVDGVVQCGEL